MRINNNISALNAWAGLTRTGNSLNKSLEKLSSGLRINRAGDDAAGLAISEKMRSQISGLNQAARNAQDGISMIQTAEGALNETHAILQRMRELAVQASNDTNTDADRAEIQKEINQLTSEINRIGNTTEFNTQKLTNGGSVGVAETSGATLTGGVDEITADSAEFTFTPSGQLDEGDKIEFTLEGKTFELTAVAENDDSGNTTTTFELGTDLADQLNNIKAALDLRLADETAGAIDISANWNVASTGTAITITAVTTGAAANDDLLGFTFTPFDDSTATLLRTTDGVDAVAAKTASGTIDFSNNLLSAGTQIKISDETFVLFDSSLGQVASTALNTTSIDIAGFTSNEQIIEAIVAADAAVDSVALSKEGTNQLKITADVAGTPANQIALSVTGPAGQQNAFDANFQIGANKGQSMNVSINDMRAQALGISSLAGTGTTISIDGESYDVAWAAKDVTDGINKNSVESALSVATSESASKAIAVIDAAIAKVSSERSKLGAYQNRLEHTINNLGVAAENLTAAESRIRDVDMAQEMMNFTKQNILSQAGTAMMAQANARPQSVLQLLG